MENNNGNRNRSQENSRNRERDWRNRSQGHTDYDEKNRYRGQQGYRDYDDYNSDVNRFSGAGNFKNTYGRERYGANWYDNNQRWDDGDDNTRRNRYEDMNRPYGISDYNQYERNYGRSNENTKYDRYGETYDPNDRTWWDRTADEVSSWFGDDDAERRRRMDKMYGPHRGKGPKGYTRSDDKIKEDINDKLYHDSYVDASDIDVTVSDGDVTLTGTVDGKHTKRRAEDIADGVTGVKNVSNNLRVNSTTASWGTSQNESAGSAKDIKESYRRN